MCTGSSAVLSLTADQSAFKVDLSSESLTLWSNHCSRNIHGLGCSFNSLFYDHRMESSSDCPTLFMVEVWALKQSSGLRFIS